MIAVGEAVVIHYSWKAATTGESTGAWPRKSRLALNVAQPTLVMFLHPHCPCTRATLEELTAILTQCIGKFECKLVFVRPPEQAAGWEESDLWQSARRLPGVELVVDSNGEEARRFAAQASGECFLYDAHGRLLFHGGITQSRGHEGDNTGRQAIISFIERGGAESNRTPVYGCSLLAAGRAETSEAR